MLLLRDLSLVFTVLLQFKHTFFIVLYFGHTNNCNTLHLQFITINFNYWFKFYLSLKQVTVFVYGRKHTTITENGEMGSCENLVSAQPRISAHSQSPKFYKRKERYLGDIGFSYAVSGFGQVLKSDPCEKPSVEEVSGAPRRTREKTSVTHGTRGVNRINTVVAGLKSDAIISVVDRNVAIFTTRQTITR